MEVFLSSKAIKSVFDSTAVQKPEDIKEILIQQQHEISQKNQEPIYSYNVTILKITIHLETTTIFHTYYAR